MKFQKNGFFLEIDENFLNFHKTRKFGLQTKLQIQKFTFPKIVLIFDTWIEDHEFSQKCEKIKPSLDFKFAAQDISYQR